MRILVCIPAIYNADCLRECIEQVIGKQDVTVIVLDNGADKDVKDVIRAYSEAKLIQEWNSQSNEFVNPAWNDFIEYFIIFKNKYDVLILLNSDLTLQKDWDKVITERWKLFPNEIIIPVVSENKNLMYEDISAERSEAQRVYDGIPGIFITMNQEQAKRCYPLPSECLVWFGDTYFYKLMRQAYDYPCVIPSNLLAYHHHSQSVQRVPRISEIIEQDKKVWNETVSKRLEVKIAQEKPL